MKVSILQSDLMPALSAVARCCGVRSQLPVLGNVLISGLGNVLKLSATNLEIGVVKEVRAEVEEEGEVTIPAKTFVEVIANLIGEKIEITGNLDQVQISTPSFSSTLNGIASTEFPSIPLSGQTAVSMDSNLLLKSLPQVTFAAAVDEGRPVLTGILTEILNGSLQFVATDGYRLAHKKVTLPESTAKNPASFKALVPRRTFEELVRIISEEGAAEVGIATSEDGNQLIFDFPDTKLSSRLIEGQFPAWEKIIPSEYKATIKVDRSEILKAVKLASVFARGEANVVKLLASPNKLVLSSETKDLGSQKKEIMVESEGEEIQVAFNTKFLLDALVAANSQQVEFKLSGSLSAAVLKPLSGEEIEYIIMPVNLS